jgi:AcrR family transcriptional regulator
MGSERSLAKGSEALRPDAVTPAPPAAQRRRRGETREALLDAALAGFSTRGFRGTSIRNLARAVGIRESSVYKHFESKQAILDALIARAGTGMADLAAQFGLLTSTGAEAAAGYQGISEAHLAAAAQALFDFVLHDPQYGRLRRLMAIEQYHDEAVSQRFHQLFVSDPLAFQTELFDALFATGEFRDGLDPQQTALAFFGPIYLLMQSADGGDEASARDLLSGHVKHFMRTHLKETP